MDTNIRNIIREELRSMGLLPIGAIFAFPSEKIPDGFLPCEGQELSCSQYPELYKLIGNTFGGTKNTFILPDLQGQFIRGLDREGNVDTLPNGELRILSNRPQADAIQGHVHSVVSCASAGDHIHYVDGSSYSCLEANTFFTTYSHNHLTDYTSGGNHSLTDRCGSHSHDILIGDANNSSYGVVRVDSETRPTNIALVFCIKVK